MLFTEYLNSLNNLQAMKMTFFNLFLIRIFKNRNLADIFTNLAEKKKMNSAEFMEFFSPSLSECFEN